MVSCRSAGTQIACSGSGSLMGVFLYPTQLNVSDGEQMKLQIITNAAECDDTAYVPTEYCLDWGDGTQSSGTFPSGYNVPKNVELTHVYKPTNYSDKYQSVTFKPTVTILTACGGIRSVGGNACVIYVFKPGVTVVDKPNMSTYKLYESFSEAPCAGTFPDCTDGDLDNTTCVDGYYRKCVDGYWARNYSKPCSTGGTGSGGSGGSGTGGGTCTYTGETKCVNGSLYQKCNYSDGTYNWVKSGTCTSTGDTGSGGGTSADTTDGTGTDIMSQLSEFYNNNKLVSILGIAILGGFVLFGRGGGSHRD